MNVVNHARYLLKTWTGAEIAGLATVDLKTPGRTTGTLVLDVHGMTEIQIVGTVVLAGGTPPAAGDADIEIQPLDEDGSTAIGDPIAIGTMSHRATAVTVKASAGWASQGSGGFGGSCTGAAAASAPAARALGKIKISVNVRVAINNATTAVFTLNNVRAMGPGVGV